MRNDLPKDLIDDVSNVLSGIAESNDENIDATDDVKNHENDSQLSQATAQKLGEEDDSEDVPGQKKKANAGSSEDMMSGNANGSGCCEEDEKKEPEKKDEKPVEKEAKPEEKEPETDPKKEEEANPFADKSDEELVDSWNLLTDVSNNIKEDESKPKDKLDAIKAEIDKRQLIKDGVQDGKLIKRKKDVAEQVKLVAKEIEGEYEIRGAISDVFLGTVVRTDYGTVVTGPNGSHVPGIPRVSRDHSLADIKRLLDIQFINEQVGDIDELKEELEKLSDDELASMWNQLTFRSGAVSDDLEGDKSRLSLIRDILTDRVVVRGGIHDGKFINPISIEKV